MLEADADLFHCILGMPATASLEDVLACTGIYCRSIVVETRIRG